jgi:hypothetical protein
MDCRHAILRLFIRRQWLDLESRVAGIAPNPASTAHGNPPLGSSIVNGCGSVAGIAAAAVDARAVCGTAPADAIRALIGL